MARVECQITTDDVYDPESGREQPGTIAKCEYCGHKTTSFGTTERSVRRCLALMAEQCPEENTNYYVASEDDD